MIFKWFEIEFELSLFNSILHLIFVTNIISKKTNVQQFCAVERENKKLP